MAAIAPAVSGVAMLVPPMKKYFDDCGKRRHPFAVVLSIVDLVDRIHVPGATTSGFTRPSAVGPRLENATTWSGSSAIGALL